MDTTTQPQQPQSTPTQLATAKPARRSWHWQRKAKPSKTTMVITRAATTGNGTSSFYEDAIEWTHRADKVINLGLGYLLAVASVLGFMDVLSNGEVLGSVPVLFFVWLAIMGLGVDFQIFLVIGRFPDLARQLNGWPRFFFVVFNLAFLGFLCYMSATIGAVFTQHRDVANSTIIEAMNSLHINATQFVYERAALATLLLVLMAIDRTMERWRMGIVVEQVSSVQAVSATQAQPSIEDLAHQMREALALLRKEIQENKVDYEQVAQVVAPLVAQPGPDYCEIAQSIAPYLQPQLTEVRRVLIEEVRAAMPHIVAQPAISQRSTVREMIEDTSAIAQHATQPMLGAAKSSQNNVSRETIYAYLDSHGGPAQCSNDDLVAALQCTIHQARRARTEYKVVRGGAQ